MHINTETVDQLQEHTVESRRITVISAGLGVPSSSRLLADQLAASAERQLAAAGYAVTVDVVELRDLAVEIANNFVTGYAAPRLAEVIAGVDQAVPVKSVRAKRGKFSRAEPVAMLYDQGRVRHAGTFPELEDEMADFGPKGLTNGRSPDRMDALVWAISELLLGPRAEPKVRRL